MTPKLISWDTETLLLSEKSLAPRIMCFTLAAVEQTPEGPKISSSIFANGDPEFREALHWLIEDESLYHVGLNLAYDLSCVCTTEPSLYPAVFRLLEQRRATDCILREKLMNLSTTGRMDMVEIRDASGRLFTKRLNYSMLFLAQKYLGVDMSDVKNAEDAWRLRYGELDGFRRDQYPQEALKYALEDAINTLRIYLEQEKVLSDTGQTPRPVVVTQEFQTLADFALHQVSHRGFKVDKARRALLESEVAKALSPENMMPLYKAGILRMGSPAVPYKNGAKNPDGTPKLKAAVEDSVDTKALKALVAEVCNKHNIRIKETPTGGISTDAEVMADIAHLDPVLTVFEKRQGWLKIVSTELPRMQADVIYTNYKSLVETGRTSSWGSSKKEAPYASMNSQNVDPRARPCYAARDGFVQVSSDYKALELVSLAQQIHRLYQSGAISLPSKLMAQLNAGQDPHAYMGGQLAKKFSPEFAGLCERLGASTPDEVYEVFAALKKTPADSEESKFYKHWRKFAKPITLGLPGGLAAKTLVGFAKATYDVIITEQEATQMREVWFQTFPEMRQFFNYVSNRLAVGDEYKYVSPMGMVRNGATYCAAANGFALQTPSAECAKRAVFNVVRACFDPTVRSVLDPSRESYLRGSYPQAFVHDEVILETPIGPNTHEACMELKKIMELALIAGMPDMEKAIQANPAMMFRWDKSAEPVYDRAGRLVPWDLEAEWGKEGPARWAQATSTMVQAY